MSQVTRAVLIPGYGLDAVSWDPLLRHDPFSDCGLLRVSYQHKPLVDDQLAHLSDTIWELLANGEPTLVVAFSLGTSVLDRVLRRGRREALLAAVGIGGPARSSRQPIISPSQIRSRSHTIVMLC